MKGGMRNKRIKYLGRPEKTIKCSEMVCQIEDADYAFLLEDHCYAVTCLTPCEVIESDQNEDTKLFEITRAGMVR